MKLGCYFLTFVLVLTPVSIGNFAWAAGPSYLLTDENAKPGPQTTLDDTIRSVLRTHKSLKAIQENRQSAIYELKASKATNGPSLDLTATSGFTNEDADKSTTTANAYYAGEVSLLLTQTIWDGHATRSRIRASESIVESTTSRVIDNATTLALDGIIAHITLIWRKKNLQLAEGNVQRHKEILDLISDREAFGADTQADLTQTQGRYVRAQSTLETTKAELLQSENSYMRYTEKPVPRALGPVKLPPKMFVSQAKILELAKANNPKAIAYTADIRTAQAERDMLRADLSPTVNIEAGYTYSNISPDGVRYNNSKWEPTMEVMAVMRWNLFQSGATLADVKAANASVREASQTSYNFMDDLTLQIENSWVDYKAAIAQYKSHQEAIGYNIQTRDLYLEQFRVGGQRSLLDVLDAESDLYNSEVLAVTAHANILISAYTLYALTGMLLPEMEIFTSDMLIPPVAN